MLRQLGGIDELSKKAVSELISDCKMILLLFDLL